jgi:alginate O-acetyltransferase complex protein AlgI
MLFDTLAYWGFFATVLLGAATLGPAGVRVFLVFASAVFYAAWDLRFLLLLGTATIANWRFGLWIDAQTLQARRHATTTAVIFNLGVLAVFKYFDFFVDSLAGMFGFDPQHIALRIALPVGVSFFTFEGIAYAVDIHRRNLRARRSLLDVALFISFFPHLVSGPIIRPVEFFPQLDAPWFLHGPDARWGLREILKGLFKKLALANQFAPIADAHFQHAPWGGAPVPAGAGVLAFALQIYFDFSGYTDIARGCARLLGYRFPANFDRPYLSRDIAEFWRCWHISLSKWLRDYLYIPLGGNRFGDAQTYRNLLIVMGLGGLWHGASWNFAIWGLYHGALLIAHRWWRQVIVRLGWSPAVEHPALAPVWVAVTFACVAIGWIPFRAPTLAVAADTLENLLTAPGFEWFRSHPALLAWSLVTLAFCRLDREQRLQDWAVARAGWMTAVALSILACLAIQLFGHVDATIPFIYFQF